MREKKLPSPLVANNGIFDLFNITKEDIKLS